MHARPTLPRRPPAPAFSHLPGPRALRASPLLLRRAPAVTRRRPAWRACATAPPGASDVTSEDVAKAARLAQLHVDAGELEGLTDDFQRIIGFFDSIKKVDVAGFEAMARPQAQSNVVRDDVAARFPDM